MTIYEPHTILPFGKFQGKTLSHAFFNDPKYIEWCIINLDHFYITGETIALLRPMDYDFTFSKTAYARLEGKYNEWIKKKRDIEEYRNDRFGN